MSPKASGIIFKLCLALALIAGAGSLWYFTIGRKPKLLSTAPIVESSDAATSHLIDSGELMLLVGNKAGLYDLGTGKPRWIAELAKEAEAPSLTPPPRPAATPVAKRTATPAPKALPGTETPDDQPDPLIAARVKRRLAKLDDWSKKLNSKRTRVKSPLQLQDFNEETAKYHAELAATRAEAALLKGKEPARPAQVQEALDLKDMPEEPNFGPSLAAERRAVLAAGAVVFVVHNRTVTALDRTNGRVTREFPLAGTFDEAFRGADCIFVVAPAGEGSAQITRINANATGAESKLVATSLRQPEYTSSDSGLPVAPNIQPRRTAFTAMNGALLQMDVQLVEKKISERASLKGDANTDWEQADKISKGGWGQDALLVAQAMANDGVRQATGGIELIDTSSYEVVLHRPFENGVPEWRGAVVGRPRIIASESIDLVAAGSTLLAFDRQNKKLWEAQLGHPLATLDRDEGDAADVNATVATIARPCLEVGGKLYLFNRAFLTAFDRTSGKVLWRLPSVGITKVQVGPGGMLYVTSTNASAETLQFSQQSHLASGALPLTLKIDAHTGKILWKLENYEECVVSHQAVYVTRETANAEDMMNRVFDSRKAPATRFKLYKLSARDGQPQWEWFQLRRPSHIAAHGRSVSLLFHNEFQVLSSMAL